MALEDILKKIEQDGEIKIRSIQNEWNQKIADEKNTLEQKVKDQYEKDLKKIEKEIEERERKRFLEAKLRQRNTVLQKKISIIDDIFSTVYHEILSLDDAKYFDILVDLVKEASSSQDEEIILNAKDKTAFGDKLIKKLGGNFSLYGEPLDIKGGLVLKKGNIETNLSFDSIFKIKRQELEQEVGKIINVI